MADPRRRHPGNVPGPWFVDTTCIDCDASAQCAPWMFVHAAGQVVVSRQPATAEEERDAARAMLACPTGSIGTTGRRPELGQLFPHPLGDTGAGSSVFYCGFNSEASYGANSYFVRRPGGNLLVDSPRWVSALARKLEEASHARPHPRQRRLPRRRRGPVLGRLLPLQPAARTAVRVLERRLVLVDGAGGIAGTARGAPVRLGAAGARRSTPGGRAGHACAAPRSRRAHASRAPRRRRMVILPFRQTVCGNRRAKRVVDRLRSRTWLAARRLLG